MPIEETVAAAATAAAAPSTEIASAATTDNNDETHGRHGRRSRSGRRGRGGRGGRGRGRSNTSKLATTQTTTASTWQPVKPILGALCLKSEKHENKVSYDEFSKSLVNYVNTELEGGSDVIPVIEEFDDIRVAWEIGPNNLTPTEEASAVKKRLQQMKVNAFFYRLLTITENMEKLWGLAWGNTSASLKSQIETDLDFNQRSKLLDSICAQDIS